MGARIDILRALSAGLGLIGLAAGCIDFVDPNIPGIEDRGSAALFDARIIVTDSGRVTADARLSPGLDFEGYRRHVTDPRLSVLERLLEPDTVQFDGTLKYGESWQAGSSAHGEPITLRAPVIEGLATAPPAVEWFGLRRGGPDSIELPSGEDLHLPVVGVEGAASPEPSIRQWFLTLNSEGRSFRFGADGVPPARIWIPRRWIPQGDTVDVRLVFTQSAVLGEEEDDYVGVVTTHSWLYWTIRVRSAGS